MEGKNGMKSHVKFLHLSGFFRLQAGKNAEAITVLHE
jgi:hypothetical protein